VQYWPGLWDDVYLGVRFLDGKYVDQQYGVMTFNLTHTHYNSTAGTYTFSAPVNVTIADNLGNSASRKEC